jgi:hypothetical protein
MYLTVPSISVTIVAGIWKVISTRKAMDKPIWEWCNYVNESWNVVLHQPHAMYTPTYALPSLHKITCKVNLQIDGSEIGECHRMMNLLYNGMRAATNPTIRPIILVVSRGSSFNIVTELWAKPSRQVQRFFSSPPLTYRFRNPPRNLLNVSWKLLPRG